MGGETHLSLALWGMFWFYLYNYDLQSSLFSEWSWPKPSVGAAQPLPSPHHPPLQEHPPLAGGSPETSHCESTLSVCALSEPILTSMLELEWHRYVQLNNAHLCLERVITIAFYVLGMVQHVLIIVSQVYCDLHGHSQKKNIFMYGCKSKNGSKIEQVYTLFISTVSLVSFWHTNEWYSIALHCNMCIYLDLRFCPISWKEWLLHSARSCAILQLRSRRKPQLVWWCGGDWGFPSATPWRAPTVELTRVHTRSAEPQKVFM